MIISSSSYATHTTRRIGDTWIYGAGADPKKTKLLRLMMRARTAVLGDHFNLPQEQFNADPALANFSRLLLKNTEHTFGTDSLSTHRRRRLHAETRSFFLFSQCSFFCVSRAGLRLGQS
jgi:hypothetical protein